MATDSFVTVTDSLGNNRKVANVQFTNLNGDTVEMQRTGDYFNDAEYLADQSASNAVVTFSFSAPVQLVFVSTDGNFCRVSTTSGTPSASLGAYVRDGETFPIPRNVSSIKVFIAAGATVKVWGYRF